MFEFIGMILTSFNRTWIVSDSRIEASVKDAAKRGSLVNMKNSQNGVKNTLKFRLATGSSLELEEFRAVSIKKLLYVWDDVSQSFIKLAGLDKGVSTAELHGYNGFDTHQQFLRQVVYGNNEIIAPVESILKLLLLEIFTPFYIFLIFTLCVWMCENYYYYTVAIIIMTVFGVSSSILQTRTNQKNLHDTIASAAMVNIFRGEDSYEEVPSTTLVPGDIIIIPSQGCEISCDAVLLNGNCIVNESMLTGNYRKRKGVGDVQQQGVIGARRQRERNHTSSMIRLAVSRGWECVPVTKTPIPCQAAVMFDSREDAPHTLFCGTKVIQTRTHGSTLVKAVVIRTGYMTAKGSLVRSILYPPPADFKFDQDSYKFIGVLAIIAAIGLIYTVIMKSEKGISPGDIAIKALDIITIVIPPALPAAMTVGKLYAQNRLKALNIFCMNSRVINVCGSLNCVCFDKSDRMYGMGRRRKAECRQLLCPILQA
ncbi:unnamed protein product [Timema podura]|uniref:Cation-transporting P-type ATPase N-terminal domain-containing protein n=1 Tax=Timema podura TaxID=61482 RepID=A0ABN7NQS2_TIMPD|nr:unnamed protein product [Timema podura]